MAVVTTPCTMLFNGVNLTPNMASSNFTFPIGSNSRQYVNFYITGGNLSAITGDIAIQFCFNPAQDAQWQVLNDLTGDPISVGSDSTKFMFTCAIPMCMVIRAVNMDATETPVNPTDVHVGFC